MTPEQIESLRILARDTIRKGSYIRLGQHGQECLRALLTAYDALAEPAEMEGVPPRPWRVVAHEPTALPIIVDANGRFIAGASAALDMEAITATTNAIVAAINQYDPARLARYEAALREYGDELNWSTENGTDRVMWQGEGNGPDLATEALTGKEKAK